MKPRFSKLSAFVLSAIALTACGGGGGSTDDSDREESVYLAFHVLDGDIENAYVYADLNRNYQWDSAKEPRARTDSRGLVTLDIAKKELNETGDTRLLIIASAGSSAPDHIYGSETALATPVTMSRSIIVNRKTPDGTTFIISPFSTLADITADNSNDSETKDRYQIRMGTLAEQAGAVKSLVYQDAGYNKDCTSPDDLKTLIAGELLARKDFLPQTDRDLEKFSQIISDVSEIESSLGSIKKLTDYVYSLVIAEISENGRINRSREEISAVITNYLNYIPNLPADDDSGKTDDDDSGKTDDGDSGKTDDDDSGRTDDGDSGKTDDDDSGKTDDDDSGRTDDGDSGKTDDDDSGKTDDDDSGKTDDGDSGKTDADTDPELTYVEITNHNLNFNYVRNPDTTILSDLDGKADVAGGNKEYLSFTPHTGSALEIKGVKYGSVRVYSDGTYRYYVPYSQLNRKNWRDYSESIIFTVNGTVYNKTFDLIQDPLFAQQDHLRNTGLYIGSVAGQDLNVVSAWQKGYTGKGVTVAIIDSEFQIEHEDLKKNLY